MAKPYQNLGLKSQCTHFTKTGERCTHPALEGEEVCSHHGHMTFMVDPENAALLTAGSSMRDVGRRVRTHLRKVWPDVEFEFLQGTSSKAQEVTVIRWTNGPTEQEVTVKLASLYSPMALGWGMSHGLPSVECSRVYSPVAVVAAVIQEMVNQQVTSSPKKPSKRWVRGIFVPALTALERTSDPENGFDEPVLQAAARMVDRCPPEGENVFDLVWIMQVCVMSILSVKRLL